MAYWLLSMCLGVKFNGSVELFLLQTMQKFCKKNFSIANIYHICLVSTISVQTCQVRFIYNDDNTAIENFKTSRFIYSKWKRWLHIIFEVMHIFIKISYLSPQNAGVKVQILFYNLLHSIISQKMLFNGIFSLQKNFFMLRVNFVS